MFRLRWFPPFRRFFASEEPRTPAVCLTLDTRSLSLTLPAREVQVTLFGTRSLTLTISEASFGPALVPHDLTLDPRSLAVRLDGGRTLGLTLDERSILCTVPSRSLQLTTRKRGC